MRLPNDKYNQYLVLVLPHSHKDIKDVIKKLEDSKTFRSTVVNLEGGQVSAVNLHIPIVTEGYTEDMKRTLDKVKYCCV